MTNKFGLRQEQTKLEAKEQFLLRVMTDKITQIYGKYTEWQLTSEGYRFNTGMLHY